MPEEGSRTERINSRLGNLSPTKARSGPALLLEPSRLWHFAHAVFCSLWNNSLPREALPSLRIAESTYALLGVVVDRLFCATPVIAQTSSSPTTRKVSIGGRLL